MSGGDHGRSAPSRTSFLRGSGEAALELYRQIERDRLLLVAAGVAFFVMLSIAPALTALVWIFGFFADPARVGAMLEDVAFLLPPEALELIRGQIEAIASSSRGGFSAILAMTMLLSLWSANAGMKAMIDAMNLIYQLREQRGLIMLNLQSLAFTLGGFAIFLLALALLIVGPAIMAFVDLNDYSDALLRYARWPALMVVATLFLTILDRFGPNHAGTRSRWSIWGSAFGALMWLGVSLAFTFYVEQLTDMAATYGSLAAIIGLMMWLWLSALVILFGFEINAVLERRSRRWDEPAAAVSDAGDRALTR